MSVGEGTTDNVNICWFALYTKPHKEYMVRDVLWDRGVETYLPQIAVVNRRKDRRAMKPFFPHYMFARFKPQGDRLAEARWTPGVRCVISAGGQPVPVPETVVAYIRHHLKDVERTESEVPFKKGEDVRVAQGPFEGLEGIFDSEAGPEGRVWVLLKVMSRLVKAELDLGDLLSPY